MHEGSDRDPLVRIIVGKGNKRMPWKAAAHTPERSVHGSIQNMLADANVPVVPSDNDGAFDIRASHILNANDPLTGLQAWLERFQHKRMMVHG